MVKTIGAAAALLGWAVRGLWVLIQALPMVIALGSIAYGVWLYDPRAAYIVVGLMLLVAIRRPKDRRKT